MDKKHNHMKFSGILLLVASIVGIIFWLSMLFMFFVLGAFVVPPEMKRGIPMIYVYITSLGFIGAIIGLVASIKLIRGIKVNIKNVITIVIFLGVVASMSFFLQKSPLGGLIALLVSILPSVPYIFSFKGFKEERI